MTTDAGEGPRRPRLPRKPHYLSSGGSKRVLLISGSTRFASTNSAFVRTAALVAPSPIVGIVYAGMTTLPHFDPDLDADSPPDAVVDLRSAIADAHAVLFCTPEYAGTLPGALKNLLEWTVGATVLTDKPVAWINVAADPRRGHGAIANLETVLGYVQARIVAEACGSVPVPRDAVGPDGLIADTFVRERAAGVLQTLVR